MRRARELRERQRERVRRPSGTVVDRLRLFCNRPLRDGDRPRLFVIAVALIAARRRHPRAARRRRPGARDPQPPSARHAADAAAPRPVALGPGARRPRRRARRATRRQPARPRADVARSKRAARRFLAGYLPLHLRPRPRRTHPRRRARAARQLDRARAARPGRRAPPPATGRAAAEQQRQPRARRPRRPGRRRRSAATRAPPARQHADGLARHRPRELTDARARRRPRRRRAAQPAPRRAASLLAILLALARLWLVLLIGVLGAIFGIQPLQARLRPVRRSRAREIPPHYLRALPAGRRALRHRPVDPRRDRPDRDRPRPLHRPRRALRRQHLRLLRRPDAVLASSAHAAPGTATASTATTTAASSPYDPADAIPAAARYLRASGRPGRLPRARSSPTTTPTGTSPTSSPRPTPTAAPPAPPPPRQLRSSASATHSPSAPTHRCASCARR